MPKWRSDLPQFFKEQGYTFGAEIGVFKGGFTTLLCEAGLEVYAIDPWGAYSEEPRQERQDFLYGHAQRTLAKFPLCHIIRKSSTEAVKDFADESLDFVYIDGDHSHAAITHDLLEWSKKVRPGGAVSGHDYSGQSSAFVKPAVDAFVQEHGLSLQLVGARKGTDWKERGDKYRSFLWIK